MKTLLTFLTIALFSFGANAQVKLKPLKKEFFDILVKEYPAKECLKHLKKENMLEDIKKVLFVSIY